MLRIKSDRVERRSDKRYVEAGQIRDFLKGRKRLVVEEKLDGSQMAIGWKNGSPYIQGRRSHISQFESRAEYNGVLEWVEEQGETLELLKGYLVFGEWLKVQHHVRYDALPDWFIAFDVWDAKVKHFLSLKKKHELLDKVGLCSIPVLHEGKLSMNTIHKIITANFSCFSTDYMEGVVIKDYERQTFLKFVVREFLEDDTTWTSLELQRLNQIRNNVRLD